LPFYADIRIAGVIAEDHATFPFHGVARPNKKVVRNLNFRWAQGRRDVGQGRSAKDVSTLYADDLSGAKFSDRKESAAVNRAVFNRRLWREIGERARLHQNRKLTKMAGEKAF
jgi:hypothetical protein